jgi:hypothetical protein
MATKKSKTQPKEPNTWGKTLTNDQLRALLKKLDKIKQEKEMSKLTDTLNAALAKKHAAAHPDVKADGKDEKAKKKTAPPVGAGKPMKKAAGRGR